MKQRNYLSYCCIVTALWLFLASCGAESAYYQKQHAIPGAKWNYKFQPAFKVDIQDAKVKHRFYLLLRHDESYANSNFWFRMKVKAPGEKTFVDGPRIEVDLADAKGEWLGRGMGGIWEHKIAIPDSKAPKLDKQGTYEIKLEQIMRDTLLPSVLNTGLIIEKTDRAKP
jgi:gliding motility-associated lipoprotein GldH